ncbi:sensor histidine kinase [Bacillus sp. S3]|uniref:sensor histidine kinase n=1 Tax=Bacillus sp. S3 TaxID=486398 RepID=UPI0016815C4D|nr:histidine kinase [Bacillus sp. S3]
MQYSNERYQEQSYQYLRNTVESNISLLDKYFSSLQNVARLIVSDQDVRTAVAYRNQVKEIDYSIELYNQRNVDEKLQQLKIMPYIKNAVIIGSNQKGLYSYKGNVKEDYDFARQKWFNSLKNIGKVSISGSYFSGFHPTDYLLNGEREDTISMVTPIQNKVSYDFKNNSYLLCDVDISSILLANTGENGVQLVINNGTEWIHLSDLAGVSNRQIEEIKRNYRKGEEAFLVKSRGWGEDDLLVVRNTTNTTGWNILGIKSLKGIQDTKRTVFLFILGMIFLSAIIIAIVSGVISKTILNPVNQLIRSFNKIANGDYSVTFEKNSSEEISMLSRTAENMIQNMLKLSDEVLLEQKKLSKEQMRALQNQINPHFLNNVLQSIKALSLNGEVEKISKLSTLLGKILSYSVYQPYEKVAIETELQYTEHYMMIQNIRFDNKIFYSIHCEKELKNERVPKLIVQPLVENALIHGFKDQETGVLNIIIEKDQSDICIIVTDNGMGMEDELVKRINEELTYKDTYSALKSIGLLNVNQRIKSEFGDAYGVKLISKIQKGTSVIITLPSIS